MTVKWSPEDDEALRAGLVAGLSFGLIARDIFAGRHSRNSCIGRAGRLRVKSQNPVPQMKPLATLPRKRREPEPGRLVYELLPTLPVAFTETPPDGLKTLFDLQAHDCRYAYGDVGEPGFGFCGQLQLEGSSYCPHHHRICWVKPPKVKRVFIPPAPARRAA